jgi:hypothetical protein
MVGHWKNRPTWGFFRFVLPDALTVFSVVTRCQLSLFGISTATWNGTAPLTMDMEDSGDAPVVTNQNDRPDITPGRSLTGQAVHWPQARGLAFAIGAWNTSPDFSSLFSDLVMRQTGLSAGAHLQIWIYADVPSDSEVGVVDFSADATQATLELAYCP